MREKQVFLFRVKRLNLEESVHPEASPLRSQIVSRALEPPKGLPHPRVSDSFGKPPAIDLISLSAELNNSK